ncbi:ribosome biogenesis factor YjgA [Granulosicoccus antarcticus]|uniref:Dual-action ribosomal maturation protein DarP n=1 Tax=Granulosicoccus antarcticus IMCC3135 TaxID=1192854 RepID=A0A2Z2P048_9GAMM|nr:ribosome biogenesis factor YjgA [Granulosicoccus antarcticus]ASJ76095.1 hypothetical protein IMCC3135_30230 [Granulosicoccus antarcticus IMCC3135]
MIDDELESNMDDSELPDDDQEEISRSQRKREADSVRDLGAHLAELGASELATIPIPEDILGAIHELHRIKAHGARKRQLGFLAKRMRQIDVEPVEAALEKIRQTARANTKNLHLVENWRDRLLGEVEGEGAKDALTAFLDEFVEADRQQFRHMQKQSIAERTAKRPPAATRQLFKAIRDVVMPAQSND